MLAGYLAHFWSRANRTPRAWDVKLPLIKKHGASRETHGKPGMVKAAWHKGFMPTLGATPVPSTHQCRPLATLLSGEKKSSSKPLYRHPGRRIPPCQSGEGVGTMWRSRECTCPTVHLLPKTCKGNLGVGWACQAIQEDLEEVLPALWLRSERKSYEKEILSEKTTMNQNKIEMVLSRSELNLQVQLAGTQTNYSSKYKSTGTKSPNLSFTRIGYLDRVIL